MFILFLTIISASVNGQKKKNVFPIWTYHKRNINIHGLAVGIASVRGEPRNTNTNGIKMELIGIGLAMPLIPESPVAQNDSSFARLMTDPISEKINGLSLSLSGTACDCVTNGISAGFVGQVNMKINGISASVFMNFAQVHNGIQAAFFMTESYKLRGLQIGAVNRSQNLRGVQLGLWNVNEKRKLPLINWNFSE